MCETKTKKRLIGLFLIPLILSIIVSAVTFGGHTAYAVTNPGGGGGPVCTLSATIYYFGSSSKQTIIQEQVGDNPDGSACSIGTTTFQKMAAPPFEYKVGGNNGKCGDTVTLNGGNAADATYQAMAIPTGGFICNKSGNAQSVAVGDTRTAALAAVTAQNGTGTQQQTTDCSISDGLGWILCPVMRMGAGIADAALGYISGSFLEVNYQLYSTNSATYNAWQWVLGFANIFFVIIFLIIIFSQATGFGISSYGIKKMLPKLIVGVVLINLSFFICSIMIDASNVTGYGLNHFFDTLAQGIKLPANTDIGANGSPFTDIVVDIIGVVAAAAVIIAAIAFFGPVLLAAIVALLMIFLFLVARQAIIILAIIVAPLAFAAWLLPNTEKLFKQWWKIFIDMLLVFPVIGLVFGASKLVSRILTSVYAGNATPDGTPTSVAVVASISTNGHGNLIGQIIAAAVLVVPLFAVPFILKGLLDSVPVAGKWAQKAYGSAVGGTRKQAQKHSDQFLGGFQAQKRAGVRNWWGGGRGAQRDKDGNYVRDAQGRLIGKRGKPLSRTWSQTWGETKKSFDDNKASYEKMADTSYKDRAARRPDTLAGRATRRSEREDVRGAAASSILGAELAHEKGDRSTQVGQWELQRSINASKQAHAEGKTAKEWEEMQTAPTDPNSEASRQISRDLAAAGTTREDLIRRANETALYSQAKTFSANKRAGDLADKLANVPDEKFIGPLTQEQAADRSLLEIAGGSIDPTAGMKRARATAVEAGFKIYDQNTAADRALLSRRMSDRQLAITRGDKNPDGTDLQAPNTILEEAMRTGDSNEVMAARDLFMSQGASGVMSNARTILALEEQEAFKGREEILNTLKRTQLSEHAKSTKENATFMVKWAQGAGTMREAMQDQGRYTALNDSQLADQSTASIITGIANGGITQERAAAILSDDTIRKQYDDQQREVLQMLKDHGADAVTAVFNPIDGKRWKDDKNKQGIVTKSAAQKYDEWSKATTTAKSQLEEEEIPKDEYQVDEDSAEPVDIPQVTTPKLPVPPIGSPTATIKDYIDQAHGVSRTARDSYVKLQKVIQAAPDRGSDNEDWVNIVQAMDADAERRNKEAEAINKIARSTVQKDVIPSDQQYTYIVGKPSERTSGKESSSQRKQAPSATKEDVARNLQEVLNFYNVNSSKIGFTQEAWNNMNQDTQNRVNEVLSLYLQQSEGVNREVFTSPGSERARDQFIETMREDINKALRGNE